MKRSFQASAPVAEQSHSHADRLDTIPDVCFIPDICRALGISRSTVKRLRRHRAFPIPEMGALDKRPRWSGSKVREFRETGVSIRHGRQSGPRLVRRQGEGGSR